MRTILLAMVAMTGCGLYTGDDVDPGVDVDLATVPAANVDGMSACEPAAVDYACPPWWLSCSRLQLRQSECRTACTVGERSCAGYTAPECFEDCVAYRYEAYCPM